MSNYRLGAGKSTLAKAIIAAYPAWTRLSIDTILAERRGIWGVDYPPELYETYQDEAEKVLNASLDELLRQGKNAVLDRSFYAREDREEIKGRIEAAGGRWCLVYLKADRDLLWRRIRERREKGINADSALDIKEELLDSYVEGFEAPQGEGEIVVDVE